MIRRVKHSPEFHSEWDKEGAIAGGVLPYYSRLGIFARDKPLHRRSKTATRFTHKKHHLRDTIVRISPDRLRSQRRDRVRDWKRADPPHGRRGRVCLTESVTAI